MNNGDKATIWRCSIKFVLLAGAIAAGVLGFGQCEHDEGDGGASAAQSTEVLRGVEGHLLLVHHHGSDAGADLRVDDLLQLFAAEPGPRNWSWICLAAPELGEAASFLSFHDGPVTLAEFRGPWEREALRAAVERVSTDYRRRQAGVGGRRQTKGNPLVVDRPSRR